MLIRLCDVNAMHRSPFSIQSWLERCAVASMVGIAYFVAACLSLHLTQGTSGFATIWPASGIFISALLLAKPGQAASTACAVGFASLGANTLFGASLPMALGFTLANLVEGVLISHLVIRTCGASHALDDKRWLSAFLGATAVGSAVSAAIAAIFSGGPPLAFFVSWFMTVCLGTLIVTPMIVTVVNGLRLRGFRFLVRNVWQLVLLVLGVAIVGSLSLSHEDGRFLFLPVIGAIAATYFFGARGAAVSISVIAIIATTQTDFTEPAIGSFGFNGETLFIQFYLISLLSAAWPLSALMAQKENLIKQYAEANAYLKLTESTAHVGHWYLGNDYTSLVWSDEVYRIHGVEPREAELDHNIDLAEDSSLALYHPEDRERVRATLLGAMERGEGFSYEARIVRPDGSTRYVSSIGHPRYDATGMFDGLFGTFQDITQQTETLEALQIARSQALDEASVAQRLAETDELTGIANRRKIMEVLRSASRVARRGNTQLTIAIIDINHFKAVNDRHGHQTGDEVLKRVAGIMSGQLRPTDYVGRLGGEEFLVVLPGESGGNGYQIIERLRVRIASETWGVAGLTSVTVSAGLATLAGEGDIDDALRKADLALYRAKECGRNVLRSAA